MAEKVLMKGNEALAESALRAGCRFFFGYPITPQTELAAYMSKRMEKVGGTFLQAESGKECKGVEYAKGNQLCTGTYSIMQPDELFFTDRSCKRINLGTDGGAVLFHSL